MDRLKLAQVFPPGDFIREELEERGWRQSDLALILGVPISFVSELLSAKRSITTAIAKKLEQALGVPAETYLNLEAQYQLSKLAIQPAGDVGARAKLYEFAQVREMQNRGWIAKARTIEQLQGELKRFYETDALDEPPQLPAAARRAAQVAPNMLTPAQITWCFRARAIARCTHAEPFSESAFDAGVEELQSLTGDPEEIRHVPRVLVEMGIRLVVVQHLSRTRIDGATLWSDKSPAIALSLRYDRIDYFWHTLSHELSHVRHGDGTQVDEDFIVDGKLRARARSEIELRADEEAASLLIDKGELDNFILRTRPYYSKERITGFARRIQVHPGIVAGQLQYRDEIDYRANREMLVKVRHIITRSAPTDGWGQVFSVAR